MLDKFFSININDWMAIYLRILAFIFAYSASIHLANILGFGESPWLETPISWRVGDIIYLIWDIVTVIGLWQRKIWGIVGFISAIFSQFLIYTIFIDYFAFTVEQRQIIYSLLGTEAILVLIFIVLLIWKK